MPVTYEGPQVHVKYLVQKYLQGKCEWRALTVRLANTKRRLRCRLNDLHVLPTTALTMSLDASIFALYSGLRFRPAVCPWLSYQSHRAHHAPFHLPNITISRPLSRIKKGFKTRSHAQAISLVYSLLLYPTPWLSTIICSSTLRSKALHLLAVTVKQ